MAQVTAALVKDLRERTGAGMMDCKKALTENGADIEAALDWLRKKGLAAAQKRPAGRRPKGWSAWRWRMGAARWSSSTRRPISWRATKASRLRSRGWQR